MAGAAASARRSFESLTLPAPQGELILTSDKNRPSATTIPATLATEPESAPAPVEPFVWSSVAKADREWLRRRTEDLHGLAYRTACDTVRIGQILSEVRGRIPKYQFAGWIGAELPWSRSNVYRFIAVGDAFGKFIAAKEMERFQLLALYMLAQPTVPPMAREYAVEMASARVVTVEDARGIIAEHTSARKPVAEPTRGELRTYDRERKAVGLDEKPAVVDESPEALAWRALEKLVKQHDHVYLTKIDDAEPFPDERTPMSVRCIGGDREQGVIGQSDVGCRLIDVVLRLAGMEPKKTCLGKCKRTLPASRFSGSATAADGRNRYCLDCERQRVKEFDRKRQEKKVAERGATTTSPVDTMGSNMEVLKN